MIEPERSAERLQQLCAVGGADGRELALLLAQEGFADGERSATNLRLLAKILPSDLQLPVIRSALKTADPDLALNGLERISGGIDPTVLTAVCSAPDSLAQLLNVCSASPFLVSILRRDPTIFSDLFLNGQIHLQRGEAECLDALRTVTPADTTYQNLLPLLRRFKYREVARIAARDLNGLAQLEEVTGELASLAAATLQVAYDTTRRQLVAEHGLPLMEGENKQQEAGMTILGMGKLGGRELNFSSDIDLIYFYSTDRGETAGRQDATGSRHGRISLHAFFAKQAELITRAISQVTEDGFVFRVDLGLRPEGKGGDMAISLQSAEIYYESWGQSWERSAMLKARPVAGSPEVGTAFVRLIEPFVYRKYLDYSLIEDMMTMKQRIDASLVREREGEYNIKLGRGGIREIEFFIQALQLVYAGKAPQLRERNSLLALEALRDGGIISTDDCATLSEAYRYLRTVEHRIQVLQERQTHTLPRKEGELTALARRCGYLGQDGLNRFSQQLEQHRQRVSTLYGGLFLGSDDRLRSEVRAEILQLFDPAADPDLVKDMLVSRRVGNVDAAYENLLTLRDGPPRCVMSERARRNLAKAGPLLLQDSLDTADPGMALANLDRFLRVVGHRGSYHALLAENREIIRLLASLFGTSQFLAKICIAHPELLESMVSGCGGQLLKEQQTMAAELDNLLGRAADFEAALDILRRYRHEEFLRIGINDIQRCLPQNRVAQQLTSLAEVCLAAAVRLAERDMARYGQPTWRDGSGVERRAGFAILGMGKLGGRELNYHSDLDIIYIYERGGITDGQKSITNHEYFARLGQKIISILTVFTREGYVYRLDTRLRPSGNAGPLVVSLDSFREYHAREAQIWERQALTKARIVHGEDGLGAAVQEIVDSSVYGHGAGPDVQAEIHRLRMRMENELARETAGSYNIKTGRGGMVDVEFAVQYLQLKHGRDVPHVRSVNTLQALEALLANGLLPLTDFTVLCRGYRFLRRLENRLRIVHDYSINDLGGSDEYLDQLALRLGYAPDLRRPGQALLADYGRITEEVRQCYGRIMGEA